MADDTLFWNVVKQAKGSLSSADAIELLAICCLLNYLSRQEDAATGVDLCASLKEPAKMKNHLKNTLKKIDKDLPALRGVSLELDVLERMGAAELTRFVYGFCDIAENIADCGEWFDEAQQKLRFHLGRSGMDPHTTPETINEIALSILNAQEGSFYDGASGLGSSLIGAKKRGGSLKLYGQEIHPKALALSKIRMFINGIGDADLRLGNVLTAPAFTKGKHVQQFDFVLMDAPFGVTLEHSEIVANDPFERFVYGVPSKRSADMAFISHALASLTDTGKGIATTIDGTLYRSGADAMIRKNIIATDIIEAVVSLPARLYEKTVLPVNLLFFNKEKSADRKGKILFVNAADRFTETLRLEKVLSEEAVKEIAETVSLGTETEDFSKWVSLDELKDGNLLPSRFIRASEIYVAGHGQVKIHEDKLNSKKTVPLHEKASFFSGFNVVAKNKESEEGKFRIVKISDVQDGKLVLDHISRYDIDNNAKVEKYRLFKGDVILSIRGQSLKTAIILADEDELLLSQNFIGIRCGSQLHPEFLKAYLESPVAQFILASKLSGTTVPTLNRKDVEALEIPDLPLKDQQAVMETYKAKTDKIERKLEELQQELKKAEKKLYKKMGIGKVYEIKD